MEVLEYDPGIIISAFSDSLSVFVKQKLIICHNFTSGIFIFAVL